MALPEPEMTFTTPGGRCSASVSANARALSGVRIDGLSTQVLPAASAGPSFQVAMYSG